MSLVKIKRFAQVTLPPEVRRKFDLREGDYVNVEATENGILLKPVAVIDREQAWERLLVSGRVKDTKPGKQFPAWCLKFLMLQFSP